MTAPSSVVKSAQNASEIGWAFVPQYYTFVNKDPSRLHCFYTKRSTLIHSTEGEEASPCFGQQEIHEKFMSLSFDDCKVFVSNVDSQSSADGGIIVQVLGEMSNEAGPWRKFAQTFFLAEQPNGFFVLNDIFRYMKEDDDDAEDEPEAEPVTVTEDIAQSEASINVVGADPALPSSNTVDIESSNKPVESAVPAPPSPTSQPAPRPVESQVTPEPSASQTGLASQVNGFHPEPRDSQIAEQNVGLNTSPSKPAPADLLASIDATASQPTPVDVAQLPSSGTQPADHLKVKSEAPAPIASIQPSASNANGRTAALQPKTAAPVPPKHVEPSHPPAPKTWASLAASGKSAWGQGHLASSQGVSSAPSATSQPVAEPPLAQSQNRQSGPGSQHPHPDRYPPVDSITTGACFIKSVNENIDEKSLRDQLTKKFGPIKELDVVRTKACGFLEFERIDSAKKAIQMSMPFNMGGKGGVTIVVASGEEYLINVESKRQPGERGRPMDAGPKRAFSDRGGRPGSNNYGPGTGRGRGGMDAGPRGSGRGGSNVPRGGGRNATNPNK